MCRWLWVKIIQPKKMHGSSPKHDQPFAEPKQVPQFWPLAIRPYGAPSFFNGFFNPFIDHDISSISPKFTHLLAASQKKGLVIARTRWLSRGGIASLIHPLSNKNTMCLPPTRLSFARALSLAPVPAVK